MKGGEEKMDEETIMEIAHSQVDRTCLHNWEAFLGADPAHKILHMCDLVCNMPLLETLDDKSMTTYMDNFFVSVWSFIDL
mgnify:CR=1 FL=1